MIVAGLVSLQLANATITPEQQEKQQQSYREFMENLRRSDKCGTVSMLGDDSCSTRSLAHQSDRQDAYYIQL